ncbi:hypothetical protein V4762_09775 [Thermodesulfobium sp. 4217-1]|uniref:hypothetical protein n=1 Tax=Thermodesulfobium sp. 4217-1 TaxID=3120013 RepID=UPI0032213EF0
MNEKEFDKLETRVKELEDLVSRLIKKLGFEKDLFENYQISKDHGKVLEVLGFSGYTIEKERSKVSNFIVENELLEPLQTVGRRIWKIFGSSVRGIEILYDTEGLTISTQLSVLDKEKEDKLSAIWVDLSGEKSNLIKFAYISKP